MSNYSIYALAENQVTISNNAELSGYSQGDGSHLLGETITLNSNSWEQVLITDGGSDSNFADSDSDQRLDGPQTIFGTTYAGGRIVEAEYTLEVTDPDGNTYTLIGFNVNEPGSPYSSYGTVEGLAFIGNFPPRGVPLTVQNTYEGPPNSGSGAQSSTNYAVPPCFAPETLIDTPDGPRPVEDLRRGDLVTTLDDGAQQVAWVRSAEVELDAEHLSRLPVRIAAGALGQDVPRRDLVVSPQHRILVGGRILSDAFREEMLVPAKALTKLRGIRHMRGRTRITWVHFALERHGIIRAEGLPAETLLLAPMVLAGLRPSEREALGAQFGPGEGGALNGPPARPLIGAEAARRRIERARALCTA